MLLAGAAQHAMSKRKCPVTDRRVSPGLGGQAPGGTRDAYTKPTSKAGTRSCHVPDEDHCKEKKAEGQDREETSAQGSKTGDEPCDRRDDDIGGNQPTVVEWAPPQLAALC